MPFIQISKYRCREEPVTELVSGGAQVHASVALSVDPIRGQWGVPPQGGGSAAAGFQSWLWLWGGGRGCGEGAELRRCRGCRADKAPARARALPPWTHLATAFLPPFQAKLASPVRKCWKRNGLIVHLLQELRGHGAADPLLSSAVQSALDDEALAEYAATYLAPRVPEVDPPIQSCPSSCGGCWHMTCLSTCLT